MPLSFEEYINKYRRRNFRLFALHFVLYRLAWLFKTESIIISAFVRSLGASNVIIGLFPMISRLGQTLPQLVAAGAVQHLPRKKPVMALLFSLPPLLWGIAFLLVWRADGPSRKLLWAFLAVYTVFWLVSGCQQVVANIVRGKIIPYDIRGRLIGIAGVAGGLGSVACTLLVIKPLLAHAGNDSLSPYALFFLVAAILFLLAWVTVLFFREPAVVSDAARQNLVSFTRDSLALIKNDGNFIRFFITGSMISVGYGTLQFYTVYARDHLGVTNQMLAWYLLVQVGSNMIGSLVYGRLADRSGNRSVLRIITALVAITPVAAFLVGWLPGLTGRGAWFCLIYFLVGFNLPIHQVLINYLLEYAPLDKHPNYLGVYNALRSLVLFVPPFLGYLMDVFYFNRVFLGMAAVLVCGWLLAMSLSEPRHRQRTDRCRRDIPLG